MNIADINTPMPQLIQKWTRQPVWNEINIEKVQGNKLIGFSTVSFEFTRICETLTVSANEETDIYTKVILPSEV